MLWETYPIQLATRDCLHRPLNNELPIYDRDHNKGPKEAFPIKRYVRCLKIAVICVHKAGKGICSI